MIEEQTIITLLNNKVIVSGNFNIHPDKPQDPLSKPFVSHLDSVGFTQNIKGPTH